MGVSRPRISAAARRFMVGEAEQPAQREFRAGEHVLRRTPDLARGGFGGRGQRRGCRLRLREIGALQSGVHGEPHRAREARAGAPRRPRRRPARPVPPRPRAGPRSGCEKRRAAEAAARSAVSRNAIAAPSTSCVTGSSAPGSRGSEVISRWSTSPSASRSPLPANGCSGSALSIVYPQWSWSAFTHAGRFLTALFTSTSRSRARVEAT